MQIRLPLLFTSRYTKIVLRVGSFDNLLALKLVRWLNFSCFKNILLPIVSYEEDYDLPIIVDSDLLWPVF
jgi:hypothetical protein